MSSRPSLAIMFFSEVRRKVGSGKGDACRITIKLYVVSSVALQVLTGTWRNFLHVSVRAGKHPSSNVMTTKFRQRMSDELPPSILPTIDAILALQSANTMVFNPGCLCTTRLRIVSNIGWSFSGSAERLSSSACFVKRS
jgi:hypothetical protein